MAYDYDKLYASTPNALGPPTKEFVTFFERLARSRARVLDIGCGQGRDALLIAAQGHKVHGVDLSQNGVASLLSAAQAKGFDITAEAIDLLDYHPDSVFDIVLCDRTLHMLTPTDQSTVLARLLPKVADGGWVLIADEKSNLARFRQVFEVDGFKWSTLKDTGGYLFMQRD